ncbi:MAG: hypothetical protein ACYCX2_02500 [Christensenellales bacterium]
MEPEYKATFEKDECEYIKGNVAEVEVKECDCEIRADVVVKKIRCIRLWGQVTTCEGRPVEEALVKLVKEVCHGKDTKLIGIAHTVTDCKGFYQFDLCAEKAEYKVIVGKAAEGKEREVCDNECDVCCKKDSGEDDKKDHDFDGKKDHDSDCKKDHDFDGKKDHDSDGKKDHDSDCKKDRDYDCKKDRDYDCKKDREDKKDYYPTRR